MSMLVVGVGLTCEKSAYFFLKGRAGRDVRKGTISVNEHAAHTRPKTLAIMVIY